MLYPLVGDLRCVGVISIAGYEVSLHTEIRYVCGLGELVY